jgi:D-3-phosphoglycerate dehydrogenase
MAACNELELPVLFTPGVNHTTVAEHTFTLLLALVKNLVDSVNATREGKWTRLTGHEIWQKKIGIVGLGRIGQEVARRAFGFQMEIHGFGNYWPEEEAAQFEITRHDSMDSLFETCDVITLHTKLTAETRNLVNAERLARLPEGAIVINTGRGELVDQDAIIDALDSGRLAGYAADVLDQEPPPSDHPLLRHPKVIVTPHIGSRTYESVPRQAMKATNNLINFLTGKGEYEQANK